MWTLSAVVCSLVIIGATASAIPNNFSNTDNLIEMSRVKRQDIFSICLHACSSDDQSYDFVYEEQHHEFGYDAEEPVSNPFTCGSVQCDVTLTNTVQRSDTYTKGEKEGWNVGLTSKISDAISLSLGHSGEVSWSWSNTKTESVMTARKCSGRPGERVTVMFKPKYQLSEGILHTRALQICKGFCGRKDKPSEPYKIKSYGKRNGYLVGEEKCLTEGGGGGQTTNGSNRGSNCRGSAQWGSTYDQWCSTNCAMNNCSPVHCTCS